ncbi:MFS general substrate transporter [Cadophora sp. DSE1049]|nr:MFS general substrate transporter [Cadophora sp. DSE1049]
MSSIFRDTAFGSFIRLITKNKFLKYPEELPGFSFPYKLDTESTTDTRNDIDKKEEAVEKVEVEEGVGLVEWYDDPANPQNWTSGAKSFVCGLICILTFTIYIGSSAYAPAVPFVKEQFNVSTAVAALGLALYVIGYGLGPLLFSPLSEVPAIGRNPLYVGTFLMYTLMILPTTLTNDLPAFMVARFLCDFFGSPALATGPASFTDMLSLSKLPYVLASWSATATMAPALGPITVGYALEHKNWHWSMYELVWLAAVLFIILFFLLPETSTSNILYRRAVRLRLLTGNPNFKSASEIQATHLQRNLKEILFNALIKPWEMKILDPAILISTVYAFPLVFVGMHRFSLGSSGLLFLTVPIGLFIAIPIQLVHFRLKVEPQLRKNGMPEPEFWLKPALVATAFAPIGLFIFAWTSSPSIHWIVPLIGVVLFQAASYQIMNSQFAYIANIYPKYAASLFAANAAARSGLAGGAILFSSPMFHVTGVMTLCSGLLFVMYCTGPNLRARSRFVGE